MTIQRYEFDAEAQGMPKGEYVLFTAHAEAVREMREALEHLLIHMDDTDVTAESAETDFERALIQARAALGK
jgi:hypothetical protein